MSYRRTKHILEMANASIRSPLGPSPNSKLDRIELKYEISPKKPQISPKKHPSRDFHAVSSIDLQLRTKEELTEKKTKIQHRVSSNQTMTKNLYLPDSIPKTQKLKDQKNSIFYTNLEKRLEILQNSPFAQSIKDYFLIFEEIIKRDLHFGPYLKKIKSGLKIWFDRNEELLEYCHSLEQKLSEKQSLINQYFIGKRQEISKSEENFVEEPSFAFKTEAKDPRYVFIPQAEYSQIQASIQQMAEKIKKLESENIEIRNFKEIQNNLQESLKDLQEKEQKYAILIKALEDRGYPVQEVYATDVLSYTDPNINSKQFYLEGLTGLSSDESDLNLEVYP